MALCGLMAATPATARFWQCAPFAREVSGIEIRGNADTWWGQAARRYDRGSSPRVGAVVAFAATSRMRVGHVAMVSKIVGAREVLLTHANWSRRGGIETDVRAVDVSSAGDWSEVKVMSKSSPRSRISTPAAFASATPLSVTSTSHQPVKRFSRFQADWPWRMRTRVGMALQ